MARVTTITQHFNAPLTASEKSKRKTNNHLIGGTKITKRSTTTPISKDAPSISPHFSKPCSTPQSDDLTLYLKKIALSHETPFRKRVLTALCQVPRGSYTTYGALSKHLSSSPRAVGNALRNNPFAPQVPCHRVLATGGGLGGFKGSWGRKGERGENDDLKVELLREEGVLFDERGKVVGSVWDGFQ